jgi:hypothetical protein
MGGAYIKGTDGRWDVHVYGTGVTACGCGRFAEYLCDWPMGRGKTCDAPMCEVHAISQGHARDNQLRLFDDPDPETEIHFCPTHDAMSRAEKPPAR